MSEVTLSDQAMAVAALEKEKLRLYSEAASIAEEQQDMLRKLTDASNRHKAVLARLIAIEVSQAKLLKVL